MPSPTFEATVACPMHEDHDEVNFVECPECEQSQADMGHNVKCEGCGYGPMPTED